MEAPDLILELKKRITEVNRIIARYDREIEHLEARTADAGSTNQLQVTASDRDKLAGELQFYRDLQEALEKKTVKLTSEELTEQRNRARDWAEGRRRGR